MTHAARVTLSRRSKFSLAGLALLIVATGLVVLYGRVAPAGNQAQAECRDSTEALSRLAPLAEGGIAALQVLKAPRRLPEFAFEGPDGPTALAHFKGRAVLFNVWATWCVPCREEMPALDRLEATQGGDAFKVLALNMDTRNTERVPAWLAQNAIGHLGLYRDPEGKAFQVLRREALVTGLPTTFLIDRAGCLLATMAGPAAWDGPDAVKAIAALTGR